MKLIIIFQIFLHVALCSVKFSNSKNLDELPLINNEELTKLRQYDKIALNLHQILKKKLNENIPLKPVREMSTYLNRINQKKENKLDFDQEIEKLKAALKKLNTDDFLSVELLHERRKRNAEEEEPNATFEEYTENSNDNNATSATATTEVQTETPLIVTDEPVVKRSGNETKDSDVSGRRNLHPDATTSSRMKDKLLSYLEDTFNEVEMKIQPLTDIKIALSNDDHYRIGYIIATIDTLDMSLKKLRNDMNQHQHHWNDERILDLFDRIKATNTVTTTLIESLKKYLH